MPGAIPDNYQPPPQHFSQQTHLIGPYQGPHQHFGNQTLPQQSTQMPVLGYEGHNCGSQTCIHGTGHHYQSQTQQEINQAENIEKVFHILRDYHSFFNYGVIERVISWFGTEDDKKRLEAYREHFERFCKRRTFECPSDIFGHCVDKGKSNLVVKVQGAMDPMWYSLENVVNLRITLGDILKVEPETFYLYRIDNGCVELMFQVPSFIEEDIFPLSVEQKRSLASIGVSKLTCGSYRYLQVCMKITLNFVGASPHNSPLLSATSTTTIFPS